MKNLLFVALAIVAFFLSGLLETGMSQIDQGTTAHYEAYANR